MYTEFSYDVNGHVGVITLRRPEARNALTYTTYRELEDVGPQRKRAMPVCGEIQLKVRRGSERGRCSVLASGMNEGLR
jgi:1,4-dihydroxy-2-naphthoyl-CoA synthase